MKKVIIFFIGLLSLLLIISCQLSSVVSVSNPQGASILTRQISNIPSWIGVSSSSWKELQSADGQRLMKYFPETQDYTNENCKYRLINDGQNISLFLDCENTPIINLMHLWVSDEMVIIPDTYENSFEFDCYIKNGLYDSVEEESRAHVKYELLYKDAYKAEYSFTLINKDKVIIKDSFTTLLQEGLQKVHIPMWLSSGLFTYDSHSYWLNMSADRITSGFDYSANFGENVFENGDIKYSLKGFPYYEGMEEYSIDNDNKEVIYKLLGGTSNMACYLKICKSDSYFNFIWFNYDNKGEIIVIRQQLVK